MGSFPLLYTSASLKYGPFQTAQRAEVPANARLSGSLQLIIFFLKTRRRENPRSRREAQRSLWHQTARANAAKVSVSSQLSNAEPTSVHGVSGFSAWDASPSSGSSTSGQSTSGRPDEDQNWHLWTFPPPGIGPCPG